MGQRGYPSLSKMELNTRIERYIEDMVSLGTHLNSLKSDQLKNVNRSVNVLDAQWNEFYLQNADIITSDEKLLERAEDYEQARNATLDSIGTRKDRIEKTAIFVKSEKLITESVEKYQSLKEKAVKLSLVKQSVPALDKLKAKEQLDFVDLQNAYQAAKEAAEVNPMLNSRMAYLQSRFIEIQNYSSKIQQLEFKPFIARIKDYVLSLAAVSIILMFGVFISNYIKTLKTAKESAKKMEEILHQNDNNIPSI